MSRNYKFHNPIVLEENHYYPFGLKHKKYRMADPVPKLTYQYKYNGMEYQDELELNFYDYGARNYDPAIGRWMNIDPLAENSRRWTPYNYAYNNPVYFIDPDGMQAYPPTDLELEGLGISIGDIQDGYQWSDTDGNWAFNGETKTWEGINETSVNIPAETQQIEGVEITINKRSNFEGNNINWDKVIDGTAALLGGTISTVGGALAVASGVGAPLGLTSMVLGIPTIGFGAANIIEGFQGGNQAIPNGPLEGIDIGFGGDGTVGQIGDVFSAGLPKNISSGAVMGYGLYKSNIGQSIISSSGKGNFYPISSFPNETSQDKTKVYKPLIRY